MRLSCQLSISHDAILGVNIFLISPPPLLFMARARALAAKKDRLAAMIRSFFKSNQLGKIRLWNCLTGPRSRIRICPVTKAIYNNFQMS